jgi:hypothetical protein
MWLVVSSNRAERRHPESRLDISLFGRGGTMEQMGIASIAVQVVQEMGTVVCMIP